MAEAIASGRIVSSSMVARKRVQSMTSPNAVMVQASLSRANDRAGHGRWEISSEAWAAPRSRVSIPIVGSTTPSSMRITVDRGTPARRASSARDNPAERLDSLMMVDADIPWSIYATNRADNVAWFATASAENAGAGRGLRRAISDATP